MQGLGNDFVVLDATREPIALTSGQISYLAERRVGVGCDQVLLIEQALAPGAQVRMRIFNADGQEVEQCGNGARCVALLAYELGLVCGQEFVLETLGGPVGCRIDGPGAITVAMGTPRFEPKSIPFVAAARAPSYALEIERERLCIGAVSLGNPHAVLRVEDVTAAPVALLAPKIQAHPRFPEGVNVGFMEVVGAARIRLRVCERGVGETPACGSGACAAVAVGRELDLLGPRVTVELPGGALSVEWNGGKESVWMTGPAERTFQGSIEL
jgi:diaminopimelate epimerase